MKKTMNKRILLLFLCVTMIFAVLGPLEAGRLSQSVAEGLNANALLTVPDQLFQYIDQQAFFRDEPYGTNDFKRVDEYICFRE